MKPMMNATRSILMTLVAGTALVAGGTAFAQVYVAPQPQPMYEQPAPGVVISLGWHGDRYWDGHRYWEHDDWMHHHPHENDQQRGHEHEHHDY